MAILYDIGCGLGGIVIGLLSDVFRLKSLLLMCTAGVSIIFLLAFNMLKPETYWVSFILMFFVGLLMAGSGTVLSSVVAADLSNNKRIKGTNQGSVVIGIIEGIGSMGAALGQSIIPRLKSTNWSNFFVALSCCIGCSQVLLLIITIRDARKNRLEDQSKKMTNS